MDTIFGLLAFVYALMWAVPLLLVGGVAVWAIRFFCGSRFEAGPRIFIPARVAAAKKITIKKRRRINAPSYAWRIS